MRATGLRIALVFVLAVVGSASFAAKAWAQADEQARVNDAATVFGEIMSAPDKGIPKAILDKTEAIAIFPGVFRAALGIGGQFGRGVICVRDAKGGWSAPAFLTIAGGSVGAQLGGQSIDIVLLIMDATGVQRLLGNQFKLGAEASVAAGPVGRSAEAATDIQMRAKILSYSRSRGLFAGIALNGSTMKSDQKANERMYGRRYKSREVVDVVSGRGDLHESVAKLRKTLDEYAGR